MVRMVRDPVEVPKGEIDQPACERKREGAAIPLSTLSWCKQVESREVGCT